MPDKTALITGAAQRVGAAITRQLHAANMNVVIHYLHSRQAAEELTAELNDIRPGSAWAVAADLCDPAALSTLIAEAIAFGNRLDVLVNNAAAFYPTPLAQITESNWTELMEVNLKAPLFLAKHAAEELREHGGCIINIADVHAERPLKEYMLYSTSKAGLVMLTKALARELAPDIRVNAVSPGAVLWPEEMDTITQQKIISHIPLKRRGNPEDVARAVLYLIRDADYVTGEILTVDGGRAIYS